MFIECKAKLGKHLLVALFYLPKIHMIVFNTIYCDLMFYGIQTLLHNQSVIYRVIAFIFVSANCIDLINLFQISLRAVGWKILTTIEKERELNMLDSMAKEDSSALMNSELGKSKADATPNEKGEAQPTKLSVDKPAMQINYTKTYRTIKANLFSMDIAKGMLDLKSKALYSEGARYYFLLHFVRMLVIQTALVAGQYVPLLSLISIIAVESFRVGLGIYCEVKYKAFLSRTVWIFEMSCSFFMAVFLVCISSYSQYVSILTENMQIAGVLLVIIIVMLEYLLAIGQLILFACIFIKRRKRSKGKKDRFSGFAWFIFYEKYKWRKRNDSPGDSSPKKITGMPAISRKRPLRLGIKEPSSVQGTSELMSFERSEEKSPPKPKPLVIGSIFKKRILQNRLTKNTPSQRSPPDGSQNEMINSEVVPPRYPKKFELSEPPRRPEAELIAPSKIRNSSRSKTTRKESLANKRDSQILKDLNEPTDTKRAPKRGTFISKAGSGRKFIKGS